MKLSNAIGTEGLFCDGDWVESKDQDPKGDVRLVQLADVGDGEYLDKSSRFMTMDKARELKCTFLQAGDVLISRMPDPIGRACVFPGDAKPSVTVVDIAIIRPYPLSIDPNWLMRAINSFDFRLQIDRYATGTTRKRISRKNLGSLDIHIPPLEEQKRIAAILDKADAIRKKRKQAIELTEQFLRSAFLDMFGDPVTNPTGFPIHRLGDLCDVRDGTHDSPKYVDEGFPLVTSKNLANGEVNLSTAKLISVTDYEQINKRSKVDSGDILMPMIGTVGNPVLVENKPDYAIKNVALIKFRKDSPSNIYIHSLLSSHYFDFISAQKNRGGTQKFLSLGDIRTLPIPLAPDGLQHKFVELRNSLHSQKSTQLCAIKEAENLFGSIIQRAFRGEL